MFSTAPVFRKSAGKDKGPNREGLEMKNFLKNLSIQVVAKLLVELIRDSWKD